MIFRVFINLMLEFIFKIFEKKKECYPVLKKMKTSIHIFNTDYSLVSFSIQTP